MEGLAFKEVSPFFKSILSTLLILQCSQSIANNLIPRITVPSGLTIIVSNFDGVPRNDVRIDQLLNSASAHDHTGKQIEVINDSPMLLLPGTTLIRFSATDSSGNTAQGVSNISIDPKYKDTSCQMSVLTQEEHTIIGEYLAIYGRTIDLGGLDYWANRLASQDESFYRVITAFATSTESSKLFGKLKSTEIISLLIHQLYGRETFSYEKTSYSKYLDSGEETIASISLFLVETASGNDLEIVENRRAVVAEYIKSLRDKNNYLLTNEEVTNILSTVSSDLASVDVACARVRGEIRPRVRGQPK